MGPGAQKKSFLYVSVREGVLWERDKNLFFISWGKDFVQRFECDETCLLKCLFKKSWV